MKIEKVSNENLVEDEYRLLVALSAHKVIREKYDDLLDEHDNVSVTLKCPPWKVSTYVCILFTYIVFYYRVVTPPS